MAEKPLDAASSHDSDSNKKSDLGILFVHGIGEQREGETLLSFGEPIIEHLRRMVTRDDHQRSDLVKVTDASLMPSRRLESHAPWSKLSISLPPTLKSQGTNQRWKLCEGWWGEQVLAPKPLTLIGWLMTRGPWIALLHVTYLERSNRPAVQHWLWAIIRAVVLTWVVWAPLVAVMQLALLVLAFLALVPLPRFGRAVSAFLLRVSGVLGDSYVLVRYETQRAAIIGRVRSVLDELRQSCDRVAIVSHSQGTAVAYEALRDESARDQTSHETIGQTVAAPPALFVTFGSGLAKLELLRMAERRWPWHLWMAGWIMPLFLGGSLLWFRHRNDPDVAEGWPAWAVAIKSVLYADTADPVRVVTIPSGALLLLALIALGISVFAVVSAHLAMRVEVFERPKPLAARWIDIQASNDPVPHGTLKSILHRDEIEVHTITNRRSYGSDHTSYFDNRAEFVPIVAEALAATASLPVGDEQYVRDMAKARKHHDRSVRVLAWTRWACVAGIPLFAFIFWDHLRAVAMQAINAVREVPGGLWDLDGLLRSVLAIFAYLLGPGIALADVAAISVLAIVGLSAWLWRRAYAPLWALWDLTMVHEALTRERLLEPVFRPIFLLIVAALGAMPLIIFLLWIFGLGIEQVLIYAIAGSVTVASFAGLLLVFLAAVLGLWIYRHTIWDNVSEWANESTAQEVNVRAACFLLAAVFIITHVTMSVVLRFTPPYQPDLGLAFGWAMVACGVSIGFIAAARLLRGFLAGTDDDA